MVNDEDKGEVDEARKRKVADLIDTVKKDRLHWEYAFQRMKDWRRFARGHQWPDSKKKDLSDADRAYVANITMRHLKTRTAAIYAKNPTFQWRRSKRMTTKLWDGTREQIMAALQGAAAGDPLSLQILMEAQTAIQEHQRLSKMGESARIAYEYFIKEQMPPAKKMMKKQVLVSLTCGVAYFKQTFQRQTEKSPEIMDGLNDARAKLLKIERLMEDVADGDVDGEDQGVEELRQLIASLENQPEILIREGLRIDYPDSTKIIPDQGLTYLPGFVGCEHVTEEYDLTPERVKEIYGVELPEDFEGYQRVEGATDESRKVARVWEVWDKLDGLVYTVCEGHDDYLREPHEPYTFTERFWPWFVYAPNAIDDCEDPFPPSDVELMQTQQAEINRSGEALRDHREAARPRWVTGSDIPEEDRGVLADAQAHSISVLKGLQPEEDIRKKLQAMPTAPIDPNLYNNGPAFDDIQRSVGSQEANFGGTSGATATETSIAESGRQSTLSSAIDEFDDLLTEMGRAGGQILFLEMAPESITEIVGPGAVWPDATRESVSKEILLEVVAGSSGRPNQAQQVAVMERVFPLMVQIPGISHEKMARHAVQVLDDGAVFDDWLDSNATPITALLGQMQAAANGQSGGTGGGSNAPAPAEAEGGGQARPGQAGFGSEAPPADIS